MSVILPPDTRPLVKRSPFIWALSLVIVLGALAQAAFLHRDYMNPDEKIVQGVVEHLSFPTQWDTNWAKAPVARQFQYDQYNFSSYHYLSYVWNLVLRGLGISEARPSVVAVRFLNPLLGALAITLLALATRRIAGTTAGLIAALILALHPLVVQDAHYARGETMMLCGVALLLWLLLPAPTGKRLPVFCAGLVLGWLVACKVTMVLAVILVPAFLGAQIVTQNNRWRKLAELCLLFGAGSIVGAFAGAPFAFVHPDAFLHGMSVLRKQYAAGWLPYAVPGATTSYEPATRYFLATTGLALPCAMAVGAVALAMSKRRLIVAGLLATLISVWLFFGSRPPFSERSFSAFIPLSAMLAGVGVGAIGNLFIRLKLFSGVRTLVWSGLVASIVLLPSARLTTTIDLCVFSGAESQTQTRGIEQQLSQHPEATLYCTELVADFQYERALARIRTTPALLVVIFDYGDAYTASWSSRLREHPGVREIGIQPGLFADLPVCTLLTFHSANLRFLLSKGSEEDAAEPQPGNTADAAQPRL